MGVKTKLLIIEDDPDGLASVVDVAEMGGFEVYSAKDGLSGVELFRAEKPDVVLSDLVLPDFDGVEVMRRCHLIEPTLPFIVMTAYGTVDSSVRALHAGAYDYIQKPLNLDDLEATLRRAAETSRLRRKVNDLNAVIRERFSASEIISASPKMKNVLSQIEAIAGTDATVMVRGESGVGKELVAKALHYDGLRQSGPFVAVNCGAFSETLLESELFGHEKGAYTGAISLGRGAFERADGGTLFLDEIGDAPLSVQMKLLRALEEREIRRLGGEKNFKVNVRVISATNRPLEELIVKGKFREDLFYRLQVVTITVPPLRERIEDIRPLVDCFIARTGEKYGRQISRVSGAFYEALEAYPWPGNVRQLRNVVESAVLLSSTGELDEHSLTLPALSTQEAGRLFTVPKGMTLEEIEREVFQQTLIRNGGNRSLTAEQLGLSRRTVQRKIKDHGLDAGLEGLDH